MNNIKCSSCDKENLSKDEVGLTKKLIDKNATKFYCIDCLAEYLGVTTDELCYKRKQKYPIINQEERKAIVEAIRYVDKVVFQTDMEKVRPVKELGADAVFVGSDWKGTDAWNQYEKDFAEVGCTVVYLDHTDGISSSILREKLNQ
jgi:glycerol-3-phosphate cytidylyltransferase